MFYEAPGILSEPSENLLPSFATTALLHINIKPQLKHRAWLLGLWGPDSSEDRVLTTKHSVYLCWSGCIETRRPGEFAHVFARFSPCSLSIYLSHSCLHPPTLHSPLLPTSAHPRSPLLSKQRPPPSLPPDLQYSKAKNMSAATSPCVSDAYKVRAIFVLERRESLRGPSFKERMEHARW